MYVVCPLHKTRPNGPELDEMKQSDSAAGYPGEAVLSKEHTTDDAEAAYRMQPPPFFPPQVPFFFRLVSAVDTSSPRALRFISERDKNQTPPAAGYGQC